ncbi:uncharacterized protein LOC143211085 [Lasioglossum baleicum]|uniref:uncharacterized protein LOC143211085 n=1 Tax=Lasioglossum baleicum TaxID=434251 RepID=UPI003FCD3E14
MLPKLRQRENRRNASASISRAGSHTDMVEIDLLGLCDYVDYLDYVHYVEGRKNGRTEDKYNVLSREGGEGSCGNRGRGRPLIFHVVSHLCQNVLRATSFGKQRQQRVIITIYRVFRLNTNT